MDVGSEKRETGDGRTRDLPITEVKERPYDARDSQESQGGVAKLRL